jgi:hypothetical protein
MGTDHGKKIKTPLRKPKVIDEIGKKKEPAFDVMKEFNKTMENFKKFEESVKQKKRQKQSQKRAETSKPAVRDALRKNKLAKESSKKTTITDTQKRGQLGLRYDLFEDRKKPSKKLTAKKVSPSSKSRKEIRRPKPKNFLPHKIQQKLPTVRDAVYTFPENKKPKFLRKKTSGSA